MKLIDIIQDLENRYFVKELTALEDTQLASQNIKLYVQHYLEVDGEVAKETKVFIYVINEGTELEEAFYKDREPESSLRPINPLVKKYQDIINSVNGKVVDQGVGWIVVDGYETDGAGGMIKKSWFADEVDGALQVKEVK